jgi:hypothetical protein
MIQVKTLKPGSNGQIVETLSGVVSYQNESAYRVSATRHAFNGVVGSRLADDEFLEIQRDAATNYVAASNTPGYDVYLKTQNAGANTGGNPRGGDLIIKSASGSGTGREGQTIFQNSAGVNLVEINVGTDALKITGKLTVVGLISDQNEIIFAQQAAVPTAPGLTRGAIWVKNTTPTTLYFTDSVGTDFQLGSGSGTINTIPKFTAASVIGNSGITDDGTTVTIAVTEFISSPRAGTSNEIFGGGAGAALAAGGTQNTALGRNALATNATGDDSTAIGFNALNLATVGPNTACGSGALGAVSTGTRNTAFGTNAGGAMTTLDDATFVGHNAGIVNTGRRNTFIGSLCGDSNTSADGNTAVGYSALGGNTSGGFSCTAVGDQALLLCTGSNNTAVGALALDALISGINCTAVGSGAGGLQTSSNGTFIGFSAGSSSSSGSDNTCIGASSGTTVSSGIQNVTVGYLSDVGGSANRCIAIGKSAIIGSGGAGNTDSIVIGANSSLGSIGTKAIIIGANIAGASGTIQIGDSSVASGTSAVVIGRSSKATNVTIGTSSAPSVIGANNVIVGSGSATALGTSDDNTIIGAAAATALSTLGGFNVIVGSAAGPTMTTNARSVIIGARADMAAAISGSIAIGSGETDFGARALHAGVIVLGCSDGASTSPASTAAAQFVAGSEAYPMTNVYFGKGVVSATATTYTINGTGGSGSDIAGADLGLAGGINTGTGAPGHLVLKFSLTGGAATTPGTLVDALKIRGRTNPAAFAAAAGSGINVFFRAQDAFAGSGGDGGDIEFTPGAADGAGTVGVVRINGKLTVTGGIDPTYLELAGTTSDTYLNLTSGSLVAVAPASQARLRFNGPSLQVSINGGTYSTISSGSAFSAFGFQAGLLNTGLGNSFFGNNAGQTNISSQGQAFFGLDAGALVTGADNSIFGASAGDSVSTGTANCLFGKDAGGGGNFSSCAIFGKGAGVVNTGTGNVFVGASAGASNVGSISQTFIGLSAGENVTGGSNTLCGYLVAATLTTGTGNLVAGTSANVSAASTASAVILGTSAVGASSTVSIGSSCSIPGTGTVGIGASISAHSASTNAVLIGNSLSNAAAGGNSVGIGGSVSISDTDAVAVGFGATIAANGNNSFVGGRGASSSAIFSVAVGPYAIINTSASNGIAIGRDASCSTAANGIAMGQNAATTHSNCGAFGLNAVSTANSRFTFGATANPADVEVLDGVYRIAGDQVVKARITGWDQWTGTATRTTFSTSGATLANVAEALKALLDDLGADSGGHGLLDMAGA